MTKAQWTPKTREAWNMRFEKLCRDMEQFETVHGRWTPAVAKFYSTILSLESQMLVGIAAMAIDESQ
jgi:hypothetical protein